MCLVILGNNNLPLLLMICLFHSTCKAWMLVNNRLAEGRSSLCKVQCNRMCFCNKVSLVFRNKSSNNLNTCKVLNKVLISMYRMISS